MDKEKFTEYLKKLIERLIARGFEDDTEWLKWILEDIENGFFDK